MMKKIILKETDLDTGSNPPSGYKYLGFDGNSLSERTGSTVSVISGGQYVPLSGTIDSIAAVEVGLVYIAGSIDATSFTSRGSNLIPTAVYITMPGNFDDLEFTIGRYVYISSAVASTIQAWTNDSGTLTWLIDGYYEIINTPVDGPYIEPAPMWIDVPDSALYPSSYTYTLTNPSGATLGLFSSLPIGSETPVPVSGNINMISQPTTLDSFSDLSLITKKYVDDTLVDPYKIYVALMTQTGTNAPTVTVLENTLGGTLVWSYTSVGRYTGTLTGAFPDSTKVRVFIQQPSTTNSSSMIYYSTINTVIIGTGTSIGTATNAKITKTAIEIRVYD